MVIKLKCVKCGYTFIAMDKADTLKKKECPLCKGALKVDNLDEIVYEEQVEKMKQDILILGKDRVWKILEKMIRAKQRARYRQTFNDAVTRLKKERED